MAATGKVRREALTIKTSSKSSLESVEGSVEKIRGLAGIALMGRYLGKLQKGIGVIWVELEDREDPVRV